MSLGTGQEGQRGSSPPRPSENQRQPLLFVGCLQRRVNVSDDSGVVAD
jgi:hypothetical protein